MCMQMSENMPGASRVNMLVMVISSKIYCKEIYLKNHNAWLFKALCYTMCMPMSYNMQTEQRVILLVIWSKIDRKTKYV